MSQANGSVAGVPTQPSSKAVAAAPKINSDDMEMGSVPGNAPPAQADIMQLARIGDIPGMEKLFEASEQDATYTDEEGITPLHVRAAAAAVSTAAACGRTNDD